MNKPVNDIFFIISILADVATANYSYKFSKTKYLTNNVKNVIEAEGDANWHHIYHVKGDWYLEYLEKDKHIINYGCSVEYEDLSCKDLMFLARKYVSKAANSLIKQTKILAKRYEKGTPFHLREIFSHGKAPFASFSRIDREERTSVNVTYGTQLGMDGMFLLFSIEIYFERHPSSYMYAIDIHKEKEHE